MIERTRHGERGMALLLSLILAVVVTSMAIGMVLIAQNNSLVSKFHANEAMMQAAAEAGLEQARDTLNGTPGLIPPGGGFTTLETNAQAYDADGNPIPGFTRSVYAGLSGNITGQYGVFASVISVINSPRGAVVVRRAELSQESFAKFARFDDVTTSSIRFARGIQVFGPLHTNGVLYVDAAGGRPTFHAEVTTASTISVAANGDFLKGYTENVQVIPMPTPTALATLNTYATAGQTSFTGGALGTTIYNPNTRIEFIPVDLNGDGDFSGEDEGFMRVFQTSLTTPQALAYVTGRRWPSVPAGTVASEDPNMISANCGGTWSVADGGDGDWWTADSIYAKRAGTTAQKQLAVRNALRSAARRCFLGGDPRLYPDSTFRANDTYGGWVAWPGWGGVPPAAIAAGILPNGTPVGATMAQYLWPVTRYYNPNFKGVVYVNGSTGVSGLVRGRVTVAASGNVMLADDLTYVTAPGSDPDCAADALGVISTQFFMLEDNSVSAPFMVQNAYITGYDESPDEDLHAAVLTLNSIQTESVFSGSTNSEVCVGIPIGRGCFNMVGSAIQGINGSRMAGSGTGWNPQWTYDRCMFIAPPPYFPTTGRYYKNRYYELDPAGFNVAAWFAANQ